MGEIHGLEKKLTGRIDGVEKRLSKEIKEVKEETKKNGKRIDMLGKQLAELDDDAPTGDEFKALEKKVEGLEKQFA